MFLVFPVIIFYGIGLLNAGRFITDKRGAAVYRTLNIFGLTPWMCLHLFCVMILFLYGWVYGNGLRDAAFPSCEALFSHLSRVIPLSEAFMLPPFCCRTACLQCVDQHIECAKQKADAKENACKGNAVIIRRSVREEHADNLSGKEVADQRQHGTEDKSKYKREFEGASVTLPVFRTDTVAQQWLNALPQSDADHAGHHCDLHGNAHNGVLHNDVRLRKQMSLPSTPVKTDSYIAV